MKFSKTEIEHLLRAWLVISLAFAILFTGGISFGAPFLAAVLVSAITVGIGFVGHELMHKYVAQRYGCWAEFRANNFMLGLALVFSFFGFIFAAPGGVFIKGHITKRKHGHVALAGPATNIVLGLLFLAVAKMIAEPLNMIGIYGMQINFFLALFNMLPFFPFDGQKVLVWSKPVYWTTLIASFILTFFTGALV